MKRTLSLALGFTHTLGNLNPSAIIVLLHLIDSLGNDTSGQITGSAIALSDGMPMSARTFQRHVANLSRRGVLHTHKHSARNGYIMPNSYSIPAWAAYIDTYELAVRDN